MWMCFLFQPSLKSIFNDDVISAFMFNLARVSVWMRHCQLYGVKHLFSVNGCSWRYTNQNPEDFWWICLFQFCSCMYSPPCLHTYSKCLLANTQTHTHTHRKCRWFKKNALNAANKCHEDRTRLDILYFWQSSGFVCIVSHKFDLKKQSIKASVSFKTNSTVPFWHFQNPWQLFHLLSSGSQHCWEAIIMLVFSVIFLPITSHF